MSHALIADGVPSDQELLQVGHRLACDAADDHRGSLRRSRLERSCFINSVRFGNAQGSD